MLLLYDDVGIVVSPRRFHTLYESEIIVITVGVVGVGHHVAGEDVDGESLPADARPSHALLHEDLSVKVPEASAEGEGAELCPLDGVPGQDGESAALQGQEVAGTARVEALEVCDEGDGAADCLVVGPVPDLLKQDDVVIGEGDDFLEGAEASGTVLRPRPTQAPRVEIQDFEDMLHCKKRKNTWRN